MDELENRLRGIGMAEPPLGFDPDEVATAAAGKARNRRAVALTGTATLAVIGAAVVFLAPSQGVTAVSPAASSSALPPQVRPHENSPRVDLTAQKARNSDHLKEVLAGVLPGVTELQVGAFEQMYGDRDWDLLTASVGYRDTAGVRRGFTLSISGVVSTRTGYTRRDSCQDKGPNGEAVTPAKGPDGQPLRCAVLSRPGGAKVVIEETGPVTFSGGKPSDSVDRIAGRHAFGFLPDGTAVVVFDLGARSGDGAIPDSGPSLTDDQLLALVLDPGFTLR